MGIEALPLEVRYHRLYQLFRFAATKADNYKLLLGRLRNQRDALTQELAKAGKWRDTLSELQRQVDASHRMLAAREDEISAAGDERRRHETELAALRLECETLQNALAERAVADHGSDETAGLRDRLAAANRELATLRASLEQVLGERDSYVAKLGESQRAYAELEAQLRDRTDALHGEANRRSDLEQRLTELQAEVEKLRHETSEQRILIASLKEAHERELRGREDDIARLQERLDATGEHVSAEVRALEASLHDLRTQAQTDAERIQALEQELLSASENAAKFEHAFHVATERVAEFEKDTQRLAEALARRDEELQEAQRAKDELTEAHLNAQRERDAAAADAESRLRELEELRAQLERVNEDLRRAREDQEAAASQLRDYEERWREAQDAQGQPETADAQSPPEPEVERVEDDAELERLRDEVGKLNQELRTLREDYVLLEQEYEALQEELNSSSFGSFPTDRDIEILSPMPPAPPDATGADDRVIIPEVVMDEPDRPDPMVNALLRFMNKERENDEVG